MTRPARLVALGGGTGLPVLLHGLRMAIYGSAPPSDATDGDRLTAIVTVSDDGGSSGRLRQAYGILAPGDIRNCLLALSDPETPLAALFDYRFNGTADVAGHSLGNLILAALAEIQSDFASGVEQGGRLLGSRGRVLPATAASVTLRAQLASGRWLDGESRIGEAGERVRRVVLVPDTVPGLPAAVAALEAADLIVLGPGSLYTSLLPPLLVRDVAAAIERSPAPVVLVANLMTEPGETDGYSLADHLAALHEHVPGLRIRAVVLNAAGLPPESVTRYAELGATPVAPDTAAVARWGARPVFGDLLAPGEKIRHDPHNLAALVLALAGEERG